MWILLLFYLTQRIPGDSRSDGVSGRGCLYRKYAIRDMHQADRLREKGIKVGLFRPISLFPFPYDRVKQVAEQVKAILVVEMNSGQMVEDVRLGAEGKTPVTFYGRMGGVVPMPDEVLEEIRKLDASLSGAS